MHPLFRLAASEPALLADHLQAYGELASGEALDVLGRWRRAALLQLAALASAAVGLTLAGVALMLWAVGTVAVPWLLVAVPALPMLVALGCHHAARGAWEQRGSSVLREQWTADLALLRRAAQS
jgi:fatty acid desaturase